MQSVDDIKAFKTLTHLKNLNITARIAALVVPEDQLAARIPGEMATQEFVSLMEKYHLDTLAALSKKAQGGTFRP